MYRRKIMDRKKNQKNHTYVVVFPDDKIQNANGVYDQHRTY